MKEANMISLNLITRCQSSSPMWRIDFAHSVASQLTKIRLAGPGSSVLPPAGSGGGPNIET